MTSTLLLLSLLDAASYLRHVGEPSEQNADTVVVVGGDGVWDAVVVHDLNATKLVVARVHLTTQNLPYTHQLSDLTALTDSQFSVFSF